MRRGTPGAIEFGKVLIETRTRAGLSMRQLAKKIGCPPATVSQVEKGQRALKEPKLVIWAEALMVNERYLQYCWNKANALDEPPIVRGRRRSVDAQELMDLFGDLSAPDRERVRGYIDALREEQP